ncbi:queD-like protein [Shewanella avicenniae]|uniref:QueD-like protein n=1 Tax=Shewanella avicenniae TaxID=2814294 RepID=A0ABX7QWC9_9GAMM|nr:VC2046/SO_2500 family protein [Shewanella avicenniae]QSX35143.1 queD-like protein [Shewanella avicenniae]
MQPASIVVNELTIAPALRSAVEQNQRGDFGLLLAMLSQDARDWPQFHLQDGIALQEKLAKQFELPPAERLIDNVAENAEVVDNSQYFLNEGATAFRLQQCLRPEALVIRGQHPLSDSEVLENLDPQTRQHLSGTTSVKLPEIPDFADQLAEQRLWLSQHQAA